MKRSRKQVPLLTSPHPWDPRKKAAIIAILVFVFIGLVAPSQWLSNPAGESPQRLGSPPWRNIRATYVEGGSDVYVPAPQAALDPNAPRSSNIQVRYVGPWPPQAKAAFEFTKRIWEIYISSPVVISVVAEWKPMGHPFILGGAKAADYYLLDDPQYGKSWYPSALANKLSGRDLDPTVPDIEAGFNSDFTYLQGWYFGTDGKLNSLAFDFVSVVLHELGHGLGFAGSMKVADKNGTWGYGSGYPFIYDRFAVNNLNQSLLDTDLFPNPSRSLAAQLTGTSLFFNGQRAVIANGGTPPRLYAPLAWEQGSSYSHLDENTFAIAAGNALMTPNLTNGEVIHDSGMLVLSMFEDIGWTVNMPQLDPSGQPSDFLYLPVIRK